MGGKERISVRKIKITQELIEDSVLSEVTSHNILPKHPLCHILSSKEKQLSDLMVPTTYQGQREVLFQAQR
jgi:hypothetical protein